MQFGPQWENQRSSYQVREILEFFFGNYMLKFYSKFVSKALHFQRFSKKSNLKDLRPVRSKKMFPETIIHKMLEKKSIFYVK